MRKACCSLPWKSNEVCDMLTDSDKVYRAVMQLGVETDTQDLTGTILKKVDTSGLMEQKVMDAVMQFEGEIHQVPPMYSALKVNGKKLCDLPEPVSLWSGKPVR